MKTWRLRLVALCAVLALLLSGCAPWTQLTRGLERILIKTSMTSFSEMEYIRPDADAITDKAAQLCRTAAAELSAKELAEQVWEFYWQYNDFYTQYALANIHYSRNLTDIYWEQEYNYCLEHSGAVDGALDQLHYALADSPLRAELETEELFGPGYFAPYDGESLWDDAFTALMDREAELIGEYYELSSQALETETDMDGYYAQFGTQLLTVLKELVAVRQLQAAQAGYDDYVSFAYDFYFYRDYTPEQAQAYCEAIRETLVPLYQQLNTSGYWSGTVTGCTQEQTFSYVRDSAQAMGGTVADAFLLMDVLGLYDIAPGDSKFDSSFETYLSSYSVPFVFVNPEGWTMDQLVFSHEFGHFCNDYASGGSTAGIDVAEFFSQGMEYLSLCYGPADEGLRRMKLADCLTVYVEQAAYASFEHRLYQLEADALTEENIMGLYTQTGREFGFDSWSWDSWDLVDVVHYFTHPMYIISYVVSNDAAVQLYQLEQQQAGAGLSVFEQSLATQEAYFLAFLESVQLQSPFEQGRLEQIRATLEEALG